VVHHESDASPNAAVAEALAKASTADEATLRLQRQIAALQHSEQLQRQAATMPQRPPSREEKLAAWRRGGMSAEDERTLAEHPLMIDHHELTAVAAHEAAQQGHERGSDGHRQRTRELFDQHLARFRQAQAQLPAEPPQFFQPPPPPEPRSAASFVSAPVSRGEVGGYREPSLRSITLSAEERALAQSLGLSETTYAKQKLEMLRKQRSGEIQK
jgi:hypothetical protein